MARCKCPVLAVGDQVELFEHDLSDQDLAPGHSHDRLSIRCEVPDPDGDDRHRALFAPFVCVDDGPCSSLAEPQLPRDLFWYHQIHRAGVDDPFDARSPDVGFDADPAVHVLAIPAVFQPHAGSNLSHRRSPLILTLLGVLVQFSDRASPRSGAWPFRGATRPLINC